MELQGKTILLLGGSGLVGRAVTRRLLEHQPAKIVLVALYEAEVREASVQLSREAGDTSIETAWGDVFLPTDAARMDRQSMLANDRLRELVINDLLGDLTEEVLHRSLLFQLFQRYKPDAVVDCINTATAVAYRDVFHSARDLLEAAHTGTVTAQQVEEHVLTLTMPQLIRHVQVIGEAMRISGTEAYVKIGTSGTGGMGLNIPYTHSEEKPSRTLLSKSAVAGAQTLLLFLVARTPGAPATVEIKPTTAIAWREIGYGTIARQTRSIECYDCPEPLPIDTAFTPGATGWSSLGKPLKSVYIDAGENGLFSRDEFETLTALGQMEFITPEEVADYVIMELQGRPTGRDVIAALDSATSGPTYRAGILRAAAIERLRALEAKHELRSVGFEMLGPPRLTKLLYEGHILSQLRETIQELADSDGVDLSRAAIQLVERDDGLRSMMVSVGIPVILPEERVYRAEKVAVPYTSGSDLERIVFRGWVDLRPDNCETWVQRAVRIVEQERSRREGSGSNHDWGAISSNDAISPSRLAAWIFRVEDDGERIKR
jgi:hypothetical protein